MNYSLVNANTKLWKITKCSMETITVPTAIFSTSMLNLPKGMPEESTGVDMSWFFGDCERPGLQPCEISQYMRMTEEYHCSFESLKPNCSFFIDGCH